MCVLGGGCEGRRALRENSTPSDSELVAPGKLRLRRSRGRAAGGGNGETRGRGWGKSSVRDANDLAGGKGATK